MSKKCKKCGCYIPEKQDRCLACGYCETDLFFMECDSRYCGNGSGIIIQSGKVEPGSGGSGRSYYIVRDV